MPATGRAAPDPALLLLSHLLLGFVAVMPAHGGAPLLAGVAGAPSPLRAIGPAAPLPTAADVNCVPG